MGAVKFDRLCVFGGFEDGELYTRNSAVVAAVSELAGEVVEVRPTRRNRADSNHQRLSSFTRLLGTAWAQLRNALYLFRRRAQLRDCDLILVPYPAYLDVQILRFVLRPKTTTVFVDAFLCLHDTLVHDRAMLSEKGIAARAARWLESSTLRFADLVMIDTEQQRQQLLEEYALEPARLLAVPVGIDESLWIPLPLPEAAQFKVLFWGTFIPLHGVTTIIRAATMVAESDASITFTLVGNGQTADEAAQLIEELQPANLQWRRELLPAVDLQALCAESHCVLGVFGDTGKAGRVVPYKAYQAMASNRPLISARGPAMEGLEAEGLRLVTPASPRELADALLAMAHEHAGGTLKAETRALYESHFSQAVISKRLMQHVAML